jgi:hypothetical protein
MKGNNRMKMRHIVIAASAAFISYGAIAGGGQQSSRSEERAVPQAADQDAVNTVRRAQERLRAAGYAVTPQGLAEFQQAKGLEPSGKLDQQTLAALGIGESASSGGSSRK